MKNFDFIDLCFGAVAAACAAAIVGGALALLVYLFRVSVSPDPDRVEYLERRVSALELAADSLQRQIDFACE